MGHLMCPERFVKGKCKGEGETAKSNCLLPYSCPSNVKSALVPVALQIQENLKLSANRVNEIKLKEIKR